MRYDKIRRYDQCAGGTHPTGMHSCSGVCEQNSVVISIRALECILVQVSVNKIA